MSTVSVHPPKTPVTKGSRGIAKATIPNVCKMPGPPAPFVPSPLPNIAKSGLSPKGYSKTVKFDGHAVAIFGATFKSIGDMASKATGGGLISANTHGPAKFITPGSLTVKVEGKSVHLLGEPMVNNLGAPGSPPNTGATMGGVKQAKVQLSFDQAKGLLCVIFCECKVEAQARKFETSVDPAMFDSPDFGADPGRGPGRAMNQACVERKLNQDYKDTNLLPEQSYNMSTTPPSPVPGRPPGSRRPDVVLNRATGPPVAPNIDIFEMKFPGDSYGQGQEEAYEEIGGGQPVTTLDSKECGC